MKIGQVLRNIFRYGRRPSEIKKAIKALCDYRCVAASKYFDRDWVARQIPGCDDRTNPVFAVLVGNINPSADFICSEYKLLHGLTDKDSHPLVHYERYGKKLGFALSFREAQVNGKKSGISNHLLFRPDQWSLEMERIQCVLRKKVLSGKRIRVCFLVYNAAIFPAKPVFERMAKDGLFSPVVLVIPSYLWPDRIESSMSDCYAEMVSQYGSECVVLAKRDADGLWHDYLGEMDMVCFPSPYNISDPHYNPHWVLHREILAFYFNYSYIVANFSFEVFKSPNYAYFWRVFCESDSTQKGYAQYSLLHGANGTVVGYVKMDSYKFTPPVKKGKELTLLIALHHTVSEKSSSPLLSIATFLLYSKLFIELPSLYPQIKFIYRPHPLLIPTLSQDYVWGSKRTEEYFAKLGNHSNVQISTSGNYFDLFSESDGLIEDCGSFLAEYFYTGKPHCYLIKSQEDLRKIYTDFGIQCLDRCYKAFSQKDITDFIDNVILKHNDSMRDARMAFRDRVMVNYPHASDSVVASIKQMLKST